MKIKDLINEKDQNSWIEFYHGISFFIKTIENHKINSILEKERNKIIVKNGGIFLWKEEYGSEPFNNTEEFTISEISYDTMRRVKADLISRNVLIGWKGINDENNNDLAFDTDTAFNLLYSNKRALNFIISEAGFVGLIKSEEDRLLNVILNVLNRHLIE